MKKMGRPGFPDTATSNLSFQRKPGCPTSSFFTKCGIPRMPAHFLSDKKKYQVATDYCLMMAL